MKAAVVAAAAEKSGDNDAEANIIREAVEEYLVRHGYITVDSPSVPLRGAESPGAYNGRDIILHEDSRISGRAGTRRRKKARRAK